MKKAHLPVVLCLAMTLLLAFALAAFAERSAGVAIDDATITTKVKYELAEDVKLRTLKDIQVDTHAGEVTLTGKTRTSDERELAGHVAQKVNGVVKVHNRLAVVPDHDK